MADNKRRIDIDLLRAVAVLSVILFHFDVPGLQGGFLGVDVFFVISGYLITTHLKSQITDGTFTFKGFYSRRILRLMPALLATLVLTAIAALWLLPSSLLQDFSESLVATSIYGSNIYFYLQTGYFDTASHLKPLLHTWSLSVEEQFYLLWPLIILIALHLKQLKPIIVVLGLVSLLFAQWLYQPADSLTFFMFPFRIFEFSIGALICGLSLNKTSTTVKSLISILGWGLITVSIAMLDELTAMPGLWSLPVCIGTALVILSAQGYNALPLRGLWLRLGLTSYSSYLLHWPLVVFYKIAVTPELSWPDIILLLFITIIGAEFLYRFVEQRGWTRRFTTKTIPSYCWLLSIPLVAVTTYFVSPFVSSQLRTNVVSQILDNTPTTRETFNEMGYLVKEIKERESNNSIVILGDSHSMNLALAIAPLIQERIILKNDICDPLSSQSLSGINLQQHYSNHMNPEVNTNNECAAYHDELMAWLVKEKPDMVIFSERWRPKALPYLAKTLTEIKERVTTNILVLGPNLEFINDPKILFNDLKNSAALNKNASNKLINSRVIEHELINITKPLEVNFISKAELICPTSDSCTFFNDEMFHYTDTNHWSEAGMNAYSRKLLKHPNFEVFLAGGVDTAKVVYDSWYSLDENKITLSMFDNTNELYVYAIKDGRSSMNGKRTLVIGDNSVQETVSALFLALKDKSGRITSYINNCPPLLTPILSEQVLAILHKKGLTAKLCEESRLKLLDKVLENNYEHIVFAYNWYPAMLEGVNKTIELLSAKSNAKIILASLKPRVFIEKNKIQSLAAFNTQLEDVVINAGINFIDMEKVLCRFDSEGVCEENIFELYQTPNILNIKGVNLLSNAYKNITE